MKRQFDEIDQTILYELDNNCRTSDTRIARIVKKSKEAVRYRIKKMIDEGTISGYYIYVNMAKLGCLAYKAYFKLRESGERKEAFLRHLKGRADVLWFGAGDGNWDAGATFFAKNHEEFYSERNKLFSEFKDVVVSQTMGSLVSVLIFGNKFLNPALKHEVMAPKVSFGGMDSKSMDELEKKIVGNLLGNGRMSLVELAGKCSSNIDTVRNRMKKLEREGIISAYLADIPAEKMGMEFYRSFLYFEGLDEETEGRLYRYCRAHQNVVSYIRVIAPWDVELEIMAKNYSDYCRIINSIRKKFSDALVNAEFMVLYEAKQFPARKGIFFPK